jgi:glutamyl-tRNA reductase
MKRIKEKIRNYGGMLLLSSIVVSSVTSCGSSTPNTKSVEVNDVDNIGDIMDKAKDLNNQAMEKAKQIQDEVMDKAEDLNNQAMEKAKQIQDEVMDKAEDLNNQAMEKAKQIQDEAMEKAEEMMKGVGGF